MWRLTAALLLWPFMAFANQGETIFHSGADVEAILAGGKVRIDGRRFACANCHGADGHGRSEGATSFPPVVWSKLATKVVTRPAYDRRLFEKAVRHGQGADGRRLSSVMPRYDLSEDQLDALTAYLRQLDNDNRLGIKATQIHIAPPADQDRVAGMQAAFERLNQAGGAFGRRLRLVDGDDVIAQADLLIDIVEERRRSAERLALIARVKQDGLTAVTLLDEEPRSIYELSREGLEHTENAPAVLAFDMVEKDSFEGKALYAPLWAVIPILTDAANSDRRLVLAGPSGELVAETLSRQGRSGFLEGYLTGTAIIEALLAVGRRLTPTSFKEQLHQTIEEDDIEIFDFR